MTLIKTSLLSAISTLIRIISAFIITKVIAMYAGPSGLALVGQLQNFIMITKTIAGDFLKTAITKYTAQYEDNPSKKYTIWSVSFKLALILNMIIGLILFFFAEEIANYLLHSIEYAFIIKILAFSLPMFVFNTILLSILNGHKQIKEYIFLNIALSVTSLVIVVVLSIVYGLTGALIAYVIAQSVVFVITWMYLRKEQWLKAIFFLYPMHDVAVKKLLAFALITLVAVLASNISLIYMRNYIAQVFTLNDAGYWQGVWLVSQVSLSLITTSLATYFLPTLASLKDKEALNNELFKASYIIIPIAIGISICIYLLRDTIIVFLYSKEFMLMEPLFLWQMVGNVIKVCGWLFGYVLVAKAMVKYTVITEVLFAFFFIVLGMYFMQHRGLVGITYAYAASSVLHLIAVAVIYKFKVR